METFQQNKLEDVKVNVTKWITSLVRQRVKLQELKHAIDDEYFITHILARLPKEYASIVDQAKIDQRTSSLSLSELRKRLEEKYRQLMKTNEWTHEEMSLKIQVNQKKPKKSGETITNKKKQHFYQHSKQFEGRCNHGGKYGHKKTDCWELHRKPNTELKQEEKEVRENMMMTKMIKSPQQNQRKMSPKMTIIVKTVRNRITRKMSKR